MDPVLLTWPCLLLLAPSPGLPPAGTACPAPQRALAAPQVLARDVVYDLIPVGQQRDWHGRLAFVMELCQGENPAWLTCVETTVCPTAAAFGQP